MCMHHMTLAVTCIGYERKGGTDFHCGAQNLGGRSGKRAQLTGTIISTGVKTSLPQKYP